MEVTVIIKRKKTINQNRGSKRKKIVVSNIRRKKSKNFNIFDKEKDKDE